MDMIKFFSYKLTVTYIIILFFIHILLCTSNDLNNKFSHESDQLENFLDDLNRFSNKKYIWYSTTNGINSRTLKKALKIFEQNTCMKFKYIKRIKKGNFGLHFLGYMAVKYPNNQPNRNKVKQDVIISNSSSKNLGYILQQTVLAMGLIPQHQRPDRDNYIKFIEMDSDYTIPLVDKYLNKYSYSEVNLFDTSYDFGSITQYSSHYFDKISSNIMVPKNIFYNKMIGQQYGLSFNDIKIMNLAICSQKCENEKKISCANSGYQDPRNCLRCKCPNGFSGIRCTELTRTGYNCHQTKLKATNEVKILHKRGYGKCYYQITSNVDTKIVIYVTQVQTMPRKICYEKRGLEIKYRNDMGATGLCLCGNYSNFSFLSEGNRVMINYNGYRNNYFTIKYVVGDK
ncbi:Astacin-like metalloendopeptidase [Strongyloides ratti]|uniref:Astacin-like metalloendopeptidase n=1 Tax=Strongyloides ratti TaxID=34506 RepID=A0A090LII0_STRRB|nr:Astacin-like metalloendopeptidase [Strongyloides ratti]CEF69552.1 Astacin-like metalloendopeptidase [Strongyloides ratti]